VSPEEWVGGDYRVVAVLNRHKDYFEKEFGLRFGDDSEDVFGELKIAGCATSRGMQFTLIQYLQSLPDKVYIEVLWSEQSRSRDLEDVLIELNLVSSDIYWMHEAINLARYDVWRQDDNGNKYVVSADICRPDAIKLQRQLESSKHKQTYWISPATGETGK
jgi:hypothetical protein